MPKQTILHASAEIVKSTVSSREEGVLDSVVGSSNVIDRMGDTISQDGWQLEAYKKTNPVILWGHNVHEERLPIGKALKVWIQDKGTKVAKLMFKIKFDLLDPFAAEVYRKIQQGFLNTVSVGFMPLEWKESDPENPWGGKEYTKQELLELSVVPVPANPEAIIALRSFGEKDKRFAPMAFEEMYPQKYMISDFNFESYKDNDDVTRYRTEIVCSNCKKKRWVDRRNIEKGINENNFTGLCSDCCRSQVGKDSNRYKNGKWYQSDGYIGILASEVEPEFQCMKDSRGYIYEHRYKIAKKLGRPLEEFEQVHHLNGIRDDNREENLELVGKDEHVLITKMQKKIKELEELITRPYSEEHACRLKNPDDFQANSFKSMTRTHDGKDYRVIMGKLNGEDTMTDQSLRYNKNVWTEGEASTHCKSKGGSFEVATGKEAPIGEDTVVKPEDTVTTTPSDTTIAPPEDKPVEPATPETTETPEDNETEPDNSGTATETIVNQPVAEVTVTEIKSGRVLSARNEAKIRQAADILNEVLSLLEKDNRPSGNEESKEDREIVEKGVIPFKDLGTMPESEPWDAGGEVAKAEVADLKLMCTWFDSVNADNKGAYKLPHHKTDGHKAVWRGVAAAMAALLGARGGVQIPDSDKKGVYNHLAKHYAQFDKEVPEFKMVEEQILKGLEEEIHALVLDREDCYTIRLIKRVLDNQKETCPKPKYSPEEVKSALQILDTALGKVK